MGGSERPLHDTGNHCAVEPYSPRRAARRGDLTNPAQTGEGGEQAELVTPRQGTRPNSRPMLVCPLLAVALAAK